MPDSTDFEQVHTPLRPGGIGILLQPAVLLSQHEAAELLCCALPGESQEKGGLCHGPAGSATN